MAGRVRVSLAASAVEDLVELRSFYSDQQAPDVGVRLLGETLARVEDLGTHPDTGRVVPEFGRENLRELIHPPLRIVYRRDQNRVRIVPVWRSERLLRVPGTMIAALDRRP